MTENAVDAYYTKSSPLRARILRPDFSIHRFCRRCCVRFRDGERGTVNGGRLSRKTRDHTKVVALRTLRSPIQQLPTFQSIPVSRECAFLYILWCFTTKFFRKAKVIVSIALFSRTKDRSPPDAACKSRGIYAQKYPYLCAKVGVLLHKNTPTFARYLPMWTCSPARDVFRTARQSLRSGVLSM